MVKVILWGGIRDLAGGATELELEAASIHQLVKHLAREYPGLEAALEDRVSIAVDGQIYRDSWFVPLDQNAEVVLLPKLVGG